MAKKSRKNDSKSSNSFKIEKKKEPISFYISEVTQNGEVHVQFSETLKPIDQIKGLDLTIISNELFFQVDYQTYVEGYQVGYENVPTLKYWNITYFGDKYFTLKLNLSNPIMVSTGDEKDKLDVSFKIPSIFQSALDERVLGDDYVIFAEVPQ